jgi:hypothetical protein
MKPKKEKKERGEREGNHEKGWARRDKEYNK